MNRKDLTLIPLLKKIDRKGGVRIALRSKRTPPLRKQETASPFFFSLRLNKNKKLSGFLYQNYNADLYQFKNAVDNQNLRRNFLL